MAEIKNVGIVGCGQMGHGIAQVSATAGYAVVVREVDDATLNKGLGKIEKQLARAVERGKSSQEDADAIRGRLHGTTDYGELADCDLVVEAITESLELKRQMWKEVTTIVKPEAFFATNTSTLAVVDQAAVTDRPDRFLGLHYFSPAQVMKQSPHHYAKRFKTPTLVTHGEQDFRVPATQALQYYDTLHTKGVAARLVYFPDENHWILKPQNSRLWYREFFAWIKRYAPGGPARRT